MAILLVEQYYDFARSLADQYLVMERGEIVARGAGADMDRDGVRATARGMIGRCAGTTSTRPRAGARASRSASSGAGDRTVLADRRHDGPLVVQKALYPEGEAVCHAIVVHPPAGIAGGDELRGRRAGGRRRPRPAHHAGRGQVVPLGGALGPAARGHRRRGRRSCVEWLPQETIVFDGARADIGLEVRLDGRRARDRGWEILCLGRTGSGERFAAGHARLATRIDCATGGSSGIERGRLEPGRAGAREPRPAWAGAASSAR